MIEARARRRLYVALVAVFIIILIALIYLIFFYTPRCSSFECFQGYMKKCYKVSYINEEPEASWAYRVIGKNNGGCEIQVTMLQAKQGELGIDKLNGQGMICVYPMGIYTYPEKDLTKCHGLLRESIQEIIINKLHTYVLENLGKFNESLNSL